jgi:histidinol-phosphatase (PHP family)
MIIANYHTHTRWCDGEGNIEDYARIAVERGFTALGFSGHAPLPFLNNWSMSEEELPDYITEVRKCGQLYKNTLQIYLGLEHDYVEGLMAPSDPRISSLGLDYIIGSVHMLKDPESGLCWSVDGPEEELHRLIEETFRGDAKEMVLAYYGAVEKMAQGGGFDFVGHFDLIKKHNRKLHFFEEEKPWYRRAVSDALEEVARAKLPLEINTGALSRGYTDEPYPSNWMLPVCRELGIPMIINADAHKPEWIDHAFGLCRNLLYEAGYHSTLMLLDRTWQEVPLDP